MALTSTNFASFPRLERVTADPFAKELTKHMGYRAPVSQGSAAVHLKGYQTRVFVVG